MEQINITQNTTTTESQFKVNEVTEQLGEIKKMIQDLQFKSEDLQKQIESEEKRTRVSDPKHFSYSPLAKAAQQRNINLNRSLNELKNFLNEKQKYLQNEKKKITENLQINDRVKEIQGKKQSNGKMQQ